MSDAEDTPSWERRENQWKEYVAENVARMMVRLSRIETNLGMELPPELELKPIGEFEIK